MRHNLDSIEEFSVEKKRRAKSRAKLNELSSQENTIACMNNIIKTLREYNFCKDVMDRLEKETAYIGKKLSISPIQSILLAVIAEEAGPSGGSADSDDITRFMGITNLELMNFTRDIEEMSSMHIVRIVIKALLSFAKPLCKI